MRNTDAGPRRGMRIGLEFGSGLRLRVRVIATAGLGSGLGLFLHQHFVLSRITKMRNGYGV